jgi:diphthamide biosynthesis enzyme Dph1/Dph2-like protein
MKKIFVQLKEKIFLNSETFKNLLKLPENIAICYSIQYENFAKELAGKLKEKKITGIFQVLGCSNPKLTKNTQAILLIGEGRFHAVSLAYETKKDVYLLEEGKIHKITREDIEDLEKKERIGLTNFLKEDNVGVLISLKPGQNRLKNALELKNKIKNKNFYFFLANDINTKEFENFGLKSWINSACPRMNFDEGSLINMNNVLKYNNL